MLMKCAAPTLWFLIRWTLYKDKPKLLIYWYNRYNFRWFYLQIYKTKQNNGKLLSRSFGYTPVQYAQYFSWGKAKICHTVCCPNGLNLCWITSIFFPFACLLSERQHVDNPTFLIFLVLLSELIFNHGAGLCHVKEETRPRPRRSLPPTPKGKSQKAQRRAQGERLFSELEERTHLGQCLP